MNEPPHNAVVDHPIEDRFVSYLSARDFMIQHTS